MAVRYTRELLETGGREVLAEAVAASTNWTDLMRRLDLKPSGGRRRALQKKVVGFGLDTSHFKKHSPWRKYTDEAIAAAAASSSSLREGRQQAGGDSGIRNVVPHKPSHRCRGDRRQSLPRYGPPPAGPFVHPGGATDGRRLGREHSRSGTRARSARRRPIARHRCRDAPQERNRHFALPQRSPGHPGGRLACRYSEGHQLRRCHARTRPCGERYEPSTHKAQGGPTRAGHKPLQASPLGLRLDPGG